MHKKPNPSWKFLKQQIKIWDDDDKIANVNKESVMEEDGAVVEIVQKVKEEDSRNEEILQNNSETEEMPELEGSSSDVLNNAVLEEDSTESSQIVGRLCIYTSHI